MLQLGSLFTPAKYVGHAFQLTLVNKLIQSVSQTLHTCTPSVISPLLTYYLSTEDPETTYTLIRRTLTALIHHVKNADQFSLLGDVLIQRFKATTTENSKDDEHLRRMLEVVAVPCAVRQGSRLTGMFSMLRLCFLKEAEQQ